MLSFVTNQHVASKAACQQLQRFWRLYLRKSSQWAACREGLHVHPAAGLSHQHRTATMSAASSSGQHTTVCFLDPRSLLDSPEKIKPEDVCELSIPVKMLKLLPEGVLELGDADDPLMAWVWGRKAELFEYQLIGSHATRSGFTSIITLQELQAAKQQGAARDRLPSWTKLQYCVGAAESQKQTLEKAELFKPFLFAGRILESSHASVYALKAADGEVEGILVSSSAAEQDDV